METPQQKLDHEDSSTVGEWLVEAAALEAAGEVNDANELRQTAQEIIGEQHELDSTTAQELRVIIAARDSKIIGAVGNSVVAPSEVEPVRRSAPERSEHRVYS